MLIKLRRTIEGFRLVQPGDTVVCALSGGADSVALTFAMYLLKEKLAIRVEAAHFNHHLRGEESDRDQAFVERFCRRYDIPLHLGEGRVVAGEKGLEAAAREARYRFFDTLNGKIATAHTADDNAETVLMHLVRGTGLKGLGGIAPKRGNLIRPLLEITRDEVVDFLHSYHLTWIEDSSNASDDFLRNRLRHRVLPLLKQENPMFAANTSHMAFSLREDEEALSRLAEGEPLSCQRLKALPGALRNRRLRQFLEDSGVKEPEASHIALVNSLVFSENPSARGSFPGGVTVTRRYDGLEKLEKAETSYCHSLQCPGETEIPEAGLKVLCTPALRWENMPGVFTIPAGEALFARSRRAGDAIRLSGGTKTLKKLFADRKIPAQSRSRLPVIASETQVLGVWSVGANLSCRETPQAWRLEFKPYDPDTGCKDRENREARYEK